jgi:hypothetical protein
MSSRTLRGLAITLAFVVSAFVCIALDACTDGTTPDCSGNQNPCGYEQPDAASQAESGG